MTPEYLAIRKIFYLSVISLFIWVYYFHNFGCTNSIILGALIPQFLPELPS